MSDTPKRIVIAPDAFKGGPSAPQVAKAIAAGWTQIRPNDILTLLPLADGGEGTVDAIATAHPNAVKVTVAAVSGPDGKPTQATYCRLDEHTAVIELAESSGLPKMGALDPFHATTRGLGEVIAHALDNGATRLLIGLGGSASTDAGTGALYALGLRATNANNAQVPDGGGALDSIRHIDTSGLIAAPSGGIQLLSDVTAPLTGPDGAAHVFGPQKGADTHAIAALDAALAHFATLCGGNPNAPGAGAAGGTGYGLATFLGASICDGGDAIALLAGLAGALATADVVITGEGSLDSSTFTGKVVHTVWRHAQSQNVPVIAIAGKVATDVIATKSGLDAYSTSVVVGSVAESLADPLGAIEATARTAASSFQLS